MKRILATALLALISAQANARCADRYYYYEAKPTVLPIEKWNIYQDLTIQSSKEIQDIKMLNEICTNTKNFRHNSAVYINYIIDANSWLKIKKPLYKNLTIQIPNGIFGNGQNARISISDVYQKYREHYFQYQTEYKSGSKISSITVYIVRKGVDEMYTPQLHFSKYDYLKRDGYFYTEFKN